jgi:hypothetical protein
MASTHRRGGQQTNKGLNGNRRGRVGETGVLGPPPVREQQNGQYGRPAAPSHIECLWLAHEKLKSENELTNQRLGWNFSFNALLSAAYGLCIQALWAVQEKLNTPDMAKLDHATDPYRSLLQSSEALKKMVHWLPSAGMAVSFMIFVGALAAQIAIMKIKVTHEKGHPSGDCYGDLQHGGHWPPKVVGGGSLLAHALGCVPLLMPWVFVILWWQLERSGPQ